jgi:TPP-dependent pyruvate/acetoin dehydrogenase alpha subunit
MNETRTASMLQRVPVILAVTANSYGLTVPAEGSRKSDVAAERRRGLRHKAAAVDGKHAAQR